MLRGGGGWIYLTYEVLRYGYGVALERSASKNSAISHTDEENTASIRRGLKPSFSFWRQVQGKGWRGDGGAFPTKIMKKNDA